MNLKSVKELKGLRGKKILLRLDLDMPIGADRKLDPGEDERLLASLPTVKFLLTKGAKLFIVGHMDRPGGQIVPELKLKPVAVRLADLLNVKTGISSEKIGVFDSYMFLYGKQEVHVLENIRFMPGEELNDKQLVKDLAKLADIYVNDAFAIVHREHASVVGVTEALSSFSGLHLAQEVKILSKVLKRPSRPLTLIIGGVKAETKMKLVEKFIPRADYILLGSAVANNFYRELGYNIGQSKYDPSIEKYVTNILARPKYEIIDSQTSDILLDPDSIKNLTPKTFRDLRHRVILPTDAIAAPFDLVEKGAGKIMIENITVTPRQKQLVPPDLSILDIGPQTSRLYQAIIKRSKTIIWNGPMGYFEKHPFDLGTYEIAKAVAASHGKGIVGGGDTVAAVNSEHVKFKQNVFVSMGGGAMLEFLLEPKLPGIKPLIKK